MPVWLQPSIEHFVKNYLFYVWVFSMFVICAGIARWYGKRQWYEREKLRRKEIGLPVASLLSVGGSSEQSFTYSSLFQGGLLGVRHVVGVFSYAIFVSVVSDAMIRGSNHNQGQLLGIYSAVSGPLLMMSLSIATPIVRHWSQNRLVRAGSITVASIFVLAAYPVLLCFVGDEMYTLGVILILALVILI
jgi:hypothetical protein